MMNRSKWWATGLLLAVFTAGLIVGGTAFALADLQAESDTDKPRKSYTERLQERLDLSEDQTGSVKAILEDWRSAVHDIWAETNPRYEAVRMAARSDILEVLDGDQRPIYEAMIRRSDSIRAEHDRKRHE